MEKVLDDLYPLLRTVQPAELNYTLNALATALEGRGNKIGESLVTLDGYLKRMNPQLPALINDIKLLAKVTDLYADVTPALAATLRNTVKTGNTLRSKEATLQKFLDDTASFSDTATAFLERERRQHHPARPARRADPGAARALLPGVPVPARRHRAGRPRCSARPSAASSSTSTCA